MCPSRGSCSDTEVTNAMQMYLLVEINPQAVLKWVDNFMDRYGIGHKKNLLSHFKCKVLYVTRWSCVFCVFKFRVSNENQATFAVVSTQHPSYHTY